MNPLDVLVEILNAGAGSAPAGRTSGGKGGSSGGADILKDILVGNGPKAGSSGSSGGVQFPGVFREGPSGGSSGRPSAKELEDMLGVGRSNPGQSAPAQNTNRTPSSPSPSGYQPQAPRSGAPQGDIFGQEPQKPAAKPVSASEQEQVVTLIRAMIYAGKADGRIDQQEQQAIIERIGNTNPETIKFLREEFANATSAKEFAWTVPIGLETAVYAATIACITIDQQSELDYVKELAHGLRLSPQVCNQIHQQYGIKPIF